MGPRRVFLASGPDLIEQVLVTDAKHYINKEEVETVRFIVCRYLELGSVYKLKAELDAKGITSKRRLGANGKTWGGRPAWWLQLPHFVFMR